MPDLIAYTASRIAGLLFLTILLIVPAFAQDTGGVKGKVRNLRGDRVGEVTITARQSSKDVKSVKSDANGEFTLSGLAPGIYDFVFEASGYSAAVKNNVQVKRKISDLGDRLFLSIDKGTQVIVNGSVFFKEGTSVTGAKVEVEKVRSDGSTQKVATVYTNIYGEFVFRQPQGRAKYRMTAKYKDSAATKDIDVETAAVYRIAISLDVARQDK